MTTQRIPLTKSTVNVPAKETKTTVTSHFKKPLSTIQPSHHVRPTLASAAREQATKANIKAKVTATGVSPKKALRPLTAHSSTDKPPVIKLEKDPLKTSQPVSNKENVQTVPPA